MKLLNLDRSKLAIAFGDCLVKFPDMTFVNRKAHQIFLSDVFWASNSRKIYRILDRIDSVNDELAIESFIGKLEKKMKGLKFSYPLTASGEQMTNFDKSLMVYTMAALLCELCIDNEVVGVKTKRTNLGPAGGKPRYTTQTTVTFSGTPVEKDLLEGYEDEPGVFHKYNGTEKLTADQQEMDKAQASIPFKVSDVFTQERMLHFYHGSTLYHAETKNEKRASRHWRFNNKYLPATVELANKEKFYLPVNHCSRWRTYYDANSLYGMRIQGKLFETSMIDAYEGRILEDSAIDTAMHIICDSRYGKMSQVQAVARFTDEDLEWALSQDPLSVEIPKVAYSAETHDQFIKFEKGCGEAINCLKAGLAIELTRAGEPCHYMLGKDLTNSGLIMLASCTGSEKMLHGANLMGETDVQDSHRQFGEAHGIYNLGRDAVKGVHTPLLHGSSVRTITNILQGIVDDPDHYTEELVAQHNIDAYGKEVANIDRIAQWGADVVTNTQNILKWKTPDGLTASHHAVMERTPLTLEVATTRVKDNCYKTHKIMATMPLALDNRGRPVYGKDDVTLRSRRGTNVKIRGLFANITHTLDGYLLRRIILMLLCQNEPFLVKHDDYIVRPDKFDEVTAVCQAYFAGLRVTNLYQEALNQIADRLQVFDIAPEVITGDAPHKALESVNFLMP